MKALLAQLSCRIGDVAGNTTRAVDALRAHPEVEIAVFPELYLSGYTYQNLDRLAREPESSEIEEIAAAANEVRAATGRSSLSPPSQSSGDRMSEPITRHSYARHCQLPWSNAATALEPPRTLTPAPVS
jgi:hypothetical protein